MKRIKKILIFVLCAFAVFITVGFLNVYAANIIYNQTSFTSTSGKLNLEGKDAVDYVCKQNNAFKAPNVIDNSVNLYADKSKKTNGGTFETTSFPKYSKLLKAEISVSNLDETYSYIKIYAKSETGEWEKLHNEQIKSNKKITVNFDLEKDFKFIKIENAVNKDHNGAWGTLSIDNIKITFDEFIPKFTIKFDTLGGNIIPSQTVNLNELVNRPNDPSRTESKFIGWYTSPLYEEENKFDFQTPINDDLTLYAKWESPSYVNFVNSTISSSLKIGYIADSGTLTLLPTNQALTFDYENINISISEGTVNNQSDFRVFGKQSITFDFSKNPSIEALELTLTKGSFNKNDVKPSTIDLNGNKITLNGAKKVEIYANSQIRISKIEFIKNNIQINNADLRFGMMMTKNDYEAMVKDGANKFSIALCKINGVEKIYDFALYNENANNEIVQVEKVNEFGLEDSTGDFYQFSVVLTDVPEEDYGVEVTGYCIVEFANDIKVTHSKTASVSSTAKQYIDATDTSSYLEHLNVLNKIFEIGEAK